jgi:hypothetical protein
VQFAAGTTQTVAGTLTLQGAAGQLLRLRSTVDGSAWSLTPNGTRTCSYVDVRDGINTVAPVINPAYGSDSGGNSLWFGGLRFWIAGTATIWSSPAAWGYQSGGIGGAPVPTLADAVYFDGNGLGGCTLDVAAGCSTLIFTSGYAGTVAFAANDLTVASGDADLRSGGSFTGSGGRLVMQGSGAQTLTPPAGVSVPALAQTGAGTTTLAINDLTLAGGLTISAGTLASGNRSITLAGDWSNAGTFTAGSGTVTLAGVGGTTQTVSGASVFNHLSATCTTARTLQFAAGTMQTVAGTLTLQGAAGQLLRLRSTVDGSAWSLTPQGPRMCSLVDVRDGINTILPLIAPAQSLDGGNTIGWFGTAQVLTLHPATTTRIRVNEGGAQVLVTIALAVAPTHDVVLPISTTAAGLNLSVSQLLFTPTDWHQAQQLFIAGVPDGTVTGDLNLTVDLGPISGLSQYAGIVPAPILVSRHDADAPGLEISESGGATQVVEAGGSDTYRVRLTAAPVGVVTVQVASDSQLLAAPASLVFDSSTWSTYQTVTVQAVDDAVAEGAHTGYLTHTASSTDGLFQAMAPLVLAVAVTDNDHADIVVAAAANLVTHQAGGIATFQVRLGSQPTAPVTIPLVSSEPGYGQVSSANLSFDDTNWQIPQTVTVTGVDAAAWVPDVPYQIAVGPATSADLSYAGQAATAVPVIYQAIDKPPTIAAVGDLDITEDAGEQTVPLIGLSVGQPGEPQTLTVAVSSDAPAVLGTLSLDWTSPASGGAVRFTPALHAWGTALVTVDVSDGITTTTRSFTVTVQSINDPPIIVRVTPLALVRGETGAWQGLQVSASVPGQLAGTDIESDAAHLGYVVDQLPVVGTLTRGGIPVPLGGGFTQEDVDAGLIAYTHDGGSGTQDSMTVHLVDGDGASSGATAVLLTIDRVAPVIELLPASELVVGERDPAVPAFPLATVVDRDSANLLGGSLQVQLAAPYAGYESLVIPHQGTGSGQIGLAGNQVTYAGDVIGTWSGGTLGSILAVDFTTVVATPVAVQALLRAITYQVTGRDPPTASRSLTVSLTDDQGNAAIQAVRPLRIVAVDDPPTLAGLDLATVPGVPVAGMLVAADVDSPAPTLRITVPAIQGTVVLNAVTGAFTYTPNGSADGTDRFTVVATSGGQDSTPAEVVVQITGPTTTARPWIISPAPLEAAERDLLTWRVQVDCSLLVATPTLAWRVEGAPAGLQLTPDTATTSALVTWQVGAVTAPTHVQFTIIVIDTISRTAAAQRVVIFCHPAGGGGG